MTDVPGSPDSPGGGSPLRPLDFDDPERIGGFTLLGRLGGGGMGTVFLARSAGGRVVALKTVHESLAREPEFRMRFRVEAEAARTTGAEHGATVVAADTQGALPWLATEYLLGPSLAEAVEHHGPLPEPAVRALGARLARALAGIHGSGVVHRDLKPSNVVVTAAGPKIIDFGIARALGAARMTRTGQVVGTPAYMSPEQATGRDHEPPGDLFALGAVLVFAVTGHGPFSGADNADVLYRVRYGEPDLTGVPQALTPVIARCLAKDPRERPGAAELADALNDGNRYGHGDGDGTRGRRGDDVFAALLPGPLRADLGRRAAGVWDLRPARLPRPAPPEAPRSQSRGPSRRLLLLAGAGTALALGGAGAAWAVFGSGDREASGTPRTAASSGPPGLAPEPLWTYDAGADATLEGVRDGVAVVLVGDGDKTRRTALGLDTRTGKVVWKLRQRRWVTFEDAGEGRFVRDLTSYADLEPPICALDPATGEVTRLPGEINGPGLGERRVLAATEDTLYLWCELSGDLYGPPAITAHATDSGELRWILKDAEGTAEGPAGAVAGDLLLVTTDRHVVARDRADGWERWRVGADSGRVGDIGAARPEAIRDGVLLVGGSEVRAVDVSAGKVRWRFGAERSNTKERPRYGVPVVHGDTVYVVTRGTESPDRPRDPYELLALRAGDGRLRWSYRVSGEVRQDVPPRFHGETLYLDTGLIPQPLLAVDLAARRPPWTYRSGLADDGRLPSWSRTSLRVGGDRLLLSCRTHVLGFPL
ncbi:protein kinase [Streptomyces sp. AC512_CC834]|uniref:serine/threonine-protein kinase n=1 Tax=Streptomyces sp. AC512_CC834 TaxID=2823691 RepID=UPI001C2717C5|nr:serine/threonine-protein kinase [Streptomyces sp. AC512_CC834]